MHYPGSTHTHSEYSNAALGFKDSTNKLRDIMTYAAQLGHDFFALTDHEMTGGWIKAEQYLKKINEEYPNFRLIRGNEIYLCRNDLTAETAQPGEKYYHFILLAKDLIGAKQLYELSTRAWMRSYVGRGIRRTPTYYRDIEEIIGRNPGHVIGATACRGGVLGVQLMKRRELLQDEMAQSAANEIYKQIKSWCNYLQNIFGKDNFYLEFQPSNDEEQIYINKEIMKLSAELNIPYIISTDAHYKSKKEQSIHAAYLNSQDGERETAKFYATTYLMDTQELESYFPYLAPEELQEAYKNITNILNSCQDYTLTKPLKIPSLKWKLCDLKTIPQEYYELIPNIKLFLSSPFEGDRLLIRHIIHKIMSDTRLQNSKIYEEVNIELDSVWESSNVNKVHWSAYFLNLQNIIDLIWRAGSIVGPARGSGGGFLLLYLLDLIQINQVWETTKLFHWRFLNPARVSVLDIDTDVSGLKRQQILQAFRKEYGEDRVANVATFGTEQSKSAILSAARGLEINNDDAQYLASLIPADRGKTRTLSQCFYGDDEAGFKPIAEFKNLMKSEEYAKLWKVAQEIEGLISRLGVHAGGVIFVDEPFHESCGLMRAPDGTVITQYELHDAESTSLIKIDLLSVEAMDKIQICIELLQKDDYIDKNLTLKEAYEQSVGIYNIERNDPKMWEMLWNHQVMSCFQMEQQSGIQGIALIKPKSVDELAVLNSVIRLMPPSPDEKRPLENWAIYRKDIFKWIKEMEDYGLSAEEIDWLSHHDAITQGICEAQEGLMSLLQEPKLGGNSLSFADKTRKAIAKKNGKLYDECEAEYYKNAKEKGCSARLVKYVWSRLFSAQRGYSFCRAHTLAYSLVGLQEMNLAYKYPTVYWNCANLIVNAGGDGTTDGQTDYDKIANALGQVIKSGIKVGIVDINNSDYEFKPDAKNNKILYGMKALSNVGNDVIEEIINNRPYKSIKDFYEKVHPKKQSMISLIKGGAFDNMEERKFTMAWYIWETCDKKSRLTLQNMPSLIKYDLLPKDDKSIQAKRVYEFNRYLKAICNPNKSSGLYQLDERAISFLVELNLDNLINPTGANYLLSAKAWDKVYQSWMDVFRSWLSANKEEILSNLNSIIFKEEWDKYASGNYSSWEMSALCFYYHEHELKNINYGKYGLSDYFKLSREPEVDRSFVKGGKEIKMFKLHKICGTCIAKNKAKSTVALLTPTGVVNVKFRKEYFSLFDKRISEIQSDGTKKLKEKSWFDRGSMILVMGIRSGDEFVAKKYASSGSQHQLYKILSIDEQGDVVLQSERYKGVEEDDD